MPKYLGFDFLSQALRQKDQLVSRMLICCPGYEQAETIFSISSKIDRNFLWYLVKAQVEKVPKKDPHGSYLLEIISSQFGRKPERFLQNTREIEYVPSSNPNSPPPSFLSDSFFDLEEEIVKEVCDYLNRHEVEITKLDACGTEKWQLEEIVMKDCFEEFLRRIPRFQDLASRLKPRKVADPLVGKDGFLRSECRTMCSRFYTDENSVNICNVGIPPKESFVKLLIPEQYYETEHYNVASPLIGSSYVPHDASVEINCENSSPIPEQKREVILEHNKYLQDLQNYCKTVSWTKHQEYDAALKYHEKPKIKSFLEINQTETNNAEKDVSQLALESPPPNYRTERKDNVNLNTQNSDLEPCQIHLGETVCIFSPRSQNKITREVVASSKFPDKISSLMLVEIGGRTLTCIRVPIVDDKKVKEEDFANGLSTLSKEDFHSELELQLHWDPLYKIPGENINQLRFTTIYQERSSPCPPVKLPDFASKLKNTLKKLTWRNVYVSSTNASPMGLEVTKEIKPSPLIPCLTVKERDDIRERNTSVSSSTQSKSSGKTIVENTTKSSRMRTSKALDGEKKDTNIHSGIDDFVLLRTGVKSSTSSSCPLKAVVKAMKVDQVVQNDDTLTKVDDFEDLTEVVEVSLTGELQTAYNYIENRIRPCLLQLQEIGCVSPSYTTTNLTGDYTRFVLKQEEKKKAYLFNTDQTCDDKKYKMLICLHTLVTTAELIKECGITVAQDYIKTISTQYNKELDGALDQIRDNLMKTERSLSNVKTLHPKIIATYNYLRAWQPHPSTLSLDDKTLVMIFRCFQEVSMSLVTQLQQIRGLKITTIERKSSLFPSLNNAHVVICDPTNIPDNFPWSSFASFITHEDKTEWLSKILFRNGANEKKIICLKGVATKEQQRHTEYKIEDHAFPEFDQEVPKQEIYTLIGSSKITKNVDLLRCLEQRCGIVIIERQYEKILRSAVTTSSKMCRQPDLVLDQRASVIIENLINFTDEEGYKNIVDLVLSASFKCQMCSIILVCEKSRNSAYSFISEVQSNLAKFHGCLMSMQLSFPHFVVDVFYSQSAEHTASLIRRLCEITRDSSNVFTKRDWARRNWLAEECSEHENFLLGFPSLNSFSAQLMLNVMPLNILLTTPFESLKTALPWIPENILKNFKETTECGLHVEEDEVYPIQIPQFPDDDIVDHEHNQYHFSPVIENTEEDVYDKESSFPRSEMSLNYFNTHFPPSFERLPQQLDHDVPSTSSLGGNVSEKVAKKKFSQHETISEKFFGNSNMFTEAKRINFDDASNYDNMYHGARQPQRRVRSPVRSTFEEIVGDISVTVNDNQRTMRGKRLLRPSKNLKRGYEMPDAVGVVQPKPREIPISDLRKPTSHVSLPAAAQTNGHRYAKPVPNYQYRNQNRTEFLWHSMYEKPVQKKKKKLTYEIVPGAKNGQTRLAFV